MKPRLLPFILVIMCLTLMGCLCSGSSGTLQNTTPEKVDSTNPTENNQKEEIFKINDSVKLEDYIVSITAIEDPYIETNQFSKPSEGKRYVAVEVNYENRTENKNISYSPLDWKLFDKEGYSFDHSWLGNKDPDLSSGDLKPGSKVKGWLTFEVLNNSTNFKIQFSPGLFSDSVEIQLF